MTQDDDEFEGIHISGPWGGVRIGSGGVRVGRDFIHDDDRDVRQARRRVREQLNFYRNLAYFVVVVGVLALLDWSTLVRIVVFCSLVRLTAPPAWVLPAVP